MSGRASLARPTAGAWKRLVTIAFVGFFVIEATAAAWLSDDAFITFRVVQNLLAGLGPRYNAAERVQAFTHPLWMGALAIAQLVTSEPYYSTLFVSLALATLAMLLLGLCIAPTWSGALLSLGMACASGGLVEYATSGLENPLTYLSIVLFVMAFLGSRPRRSRALAVGFTACLLLLNRLDHALLVLPAIALEVSTSGRERIRSLAWIAVGFLPLVAWEAFSLVYYGVPFPNTAYAKLGTGVPGAALAMQGMWYLRDALEHDAATLLIFPVATAIALSSRDRRLVALLAGVALHLVYVVKIGGDFMSGRFLTGPSLVALTICAQVRFRPAFTLVATAAALGLSNPAFPYVPVDGEARYRSGGIDAHGICDERALYFPYTGLIRPATQEGSDPVDHPRRQEGLAARARHVPVLSKEAIGIAGYYAGPAVHVLDPLALSDPLLARLPALEGRWRIGHFARVVPRGYVETLATGVNHIADPELARFYDELSLVVRGRIWSRERFAAIWRLNTGESARLIDADRWRRGASPLGDE